jgi:hypothetical protein
MIVMLPFSDKEIDRTRDLLAFIAEIEGNPIEHHPLVLLSSAMVSTEDRVAMHKLGSAAFQNMTSIVQNNANEFPWPQNANAMFQVANEWIRQNWNSHWLWLETDMVPLRVGFLDLLEAEYTTARKPFMGALFEHPKPHLNGGMIMPARIAGYNPMMLAATVVPWDMTRPDLTMKNGHATKLIHRALADWQTNTPMTFPDAESLKAIPDSCILYHGCKDGTLIARLRERAGLPVKLQPKAKLFPRIVKSVIEAVRGKPHLADVTLVCVDTNRPDLGLRAIQRTLDHCSFGDVLFFTNQDRMPYAVKIPHINGLQGYCDFLIRQAPDYVSTKHALIVQWDGYVLDGNAWKPEFLQWDYIGAPSDIGDNGKICVGNGGFSLRSKKLMDAIRQFPGPYCPEDQIICIRYRQELERRGIRFAPEALAKMFSAEIIAPYANQFGFHSFATRLPDRIDRPKVFHHSGDWGDIIYGLPAIKALGGGVLFISPQCHPKMPPRQTPTNGSVAALQPLFHQQPWIWQCRHTRRVPDSTDYDLNRFRDGYKNNTNSLVAKQLAVCRTDWPEDKPWLQVDFPVTIPKRPILVHMCPRYRRFNNTFPWKALIERWGHKIAVVGLPDEHAALIAECGYVPFIHTHDFLELARLIVGCKVFIGSQSSPMAIALGLGQNVIQELLMEDQNCKLNRKNAIYVKEGDNVEIPKAWLK